MDRHAADVVSRKQTHRMRFEADDECDNDALRDAADEGLPVRPRIKCPPEMLFTVDQVRSIVDKAVAEREQVLAQQYDQILNERLAEQAQSFAKYHQSVLQSRMAPTPSCLPAAESVAPLMPRRRHHVTGRGRVNCVCSMCVRCWSAICSAA